MIGIIRCIIGMLAMAPLCVVAQNNTISWNKVFTGTVGNNAATMYLQKTGSTYNGYYYYDSRQQPIRLQNANHSSVDSVYISAYDDQKIEFFNGIYTNGIFSGIWKNTLDDKLLTSLRFSFTESKTAPPPYFDVVYTNYETSYPASKQKRQQPHV